ncbi:PB1 domain-containing protein [Dioscorea alata]|uniref:PB1 domain-containing protein n=2 Tax=Dioscorea alata TaxID=55571 RepID=A0ACB7UDL4_DIOAL|nr:PB1 domain-containing protein [Dioscorea alata]KAH7658412.1 PB1 domain-containing protein [Dioscorea alata]
MELAGAASVAGLAYPDSVDSSPLSRGRESWDDPPAAADALPLKLRFMCSYGGRIVPRPTDKSLCYLGGETRITVVDRHSTLADLSSRLSRSLLGGRAFSLKYQLPNEDLDALISVSSDEDLENMIDEYDRLLQGGGGAGSSSRSSRIRLFLFPSKPESAPSSIGSGSLLEDSKSETWFVDALNTGIGSAGALPRGLSADSASVNCLLGLEDDSSTHSRADVEQHVLHRPDSSGRLPLVADSPMLETTSSGPQPCLSNLPPIPVWPEDRSPDRRVGGLDDHFSQMNLSAGTHPPQMPIPLPPVSSTTLSILPSEIPNRVFSDDEKSEKSDQNAVRKTPAPPMQTIQSQFPPKIESPIPESLPRPFYANSITESKREAPPRMPPPSSTMQPEQHQHQHQHQHFVATNPHYLHHQHTATMVPIQSYYQIPQQSQQPHHFDSQIHPMYYLPVHSNPSTIPTSAAATRPSLLPSGIPYHMISNYGYEYAAAAAAAATAAPDSSHSQLYYTQPTQSPAPAPPPPTPADTKPTRAS